MPGLETGSLFALVGVLILAAAFAAFIVAARLRGRHGLTGGPVVYSDTGAAEVAAKPFFSRAYGLTGKPDYLLQTRRGLVPVEVKPGRDDTEPRDSHLLQVLAYCLLLEDHYGKPPPYGLLRYRTATFRVDYNRQTRAYLLSVIAEMRGIAGHDGEEAHRSHEQPARCRACGYRPICEESLWEAT